MNVLKTYHYCFLVTYVAGEKLCSNQDLFPVEVVDHMFSLESSRIFLVSEHNSEVS